MLATEGFHIAAATQAGVHVFSAATGRWRKLGIPHTGATSPAVRSGDFLSVVRISRGTYRAYSARLDRYRDISFDNDPDQNFICVDDDVALIVGIISGTATEFACAYSAQTNGWARIKSRGRQQVVCSRFVAGLRTNSRAYGFSARKGNWVGTPCGSACSLKADGGRQRLAR